MPRKVLEPDNAGAPQTLETLQETFKVEIQQLRNRINEIDSAIPRLTREREQLVGMIMVMSKVVEDGAHEPKVNGNAQDSIGGQGDGEI